MKIQISDTVFLTSSSRCFQLSRLNTHNQLKAFAFFTDLEPLFIEFLNHKIRNAKAVEFSELVLLTVEAVKEVKKCVKTLRGVKIAK